MKNNKVDIIVIGDVDDNVIDLAKTYFDFGVKNKNNPIDFEDKVIEKVEYVKKRTKSKQSQRMNPKTTCPLTSTPN